MTAIGDHCNTVRGWLNFEYSDELITSWTRMAEEYLSENMRCKHMVQIDRAVITEGRVAMPLDWIEIDYVRIEGSSPLHYRIRDEFFTNLENGQYHNSGHYTVVGNYLLIGGGVDAVNTKTIELSYYQNIPPLGDDPNWLMKYYSRLYVTATLSVACAYSVEDERAAMWQASVNDFVNSINSSHKSSRYGGSPLVKRNRKGFG